MSLVIALIFGLCDGAAALEPREILIIANGHIAESVEIARYYCQARGVPPENILRLPLGRKPSGTISRQDYERLLVRPIREEFDTAQLLGKIKCLLTVYGVPMKVGPRGPLTEKSSALQYVKQPVDQLQQTLKQLEQDGQTNSSPYRQSKDRLRRLQAVIAQIQGKETHASVDSELSMALFDSYELYRWQPNVLHKDAEDLFKLAPRTLMVSRLDGPAQAIVTRLVEKAMAAEKMGLRGTAYIDSRGIQGKSQYGRFDQSLRDLATLIEAQTDLPVVHEQTGQLFAPGACPQTALYCGWYSLRKYVDAFDFVDGAVGYHIASFEAVSLRDPNSSQWCPAMLQDGITATLGPVAEPYLHAFPEPKAFFEQLCQGRCLVEAYYRTKPFNSWQLLLIGDPLYRPFKKSGQD